MKFEFNLWCFPISSTRSNSIMLKEKVWKLPSFWDAWDAMHILYFYPPWALFLGCYTCSRIVSVLLPIYDFYHGNFHDNVLLKERVPTAKKETNLLQDEHQDDEVNKEGHTTNNMFVDDISISSDDSYNTQTIDNCS